MHLKNKKKELNLIYYCALRLGSIIGQSLSTSSREARESSQSVILQKQTDQLDFKPSAEDDVVKPNSSPTREGATHVGTLQDCCKLQKIQVRRERGTGQRCQAKQQTKRTTLIRPADTLSWICSTLTEFRN